MSRPSTTSWRTSGWRSRRATPGSCCGAKATVSGYYIQRRSSKRRDPHFVTMEQEVFGPAHRIVYDDARYPETLRLCDSTSPYALTGAVFSPRPLPFVRPAGSCATPRQTSTSTTSQPGQMVGPAALRGSRGSGTQRQGGRTAQPVALDQPADRSMENLPGGDGVSVPVHEVATRERSPTPCRTSARGLWFTDQAEQAVAFLRQPSSLIPTSCGRRTTWRAHLPRSARLLTIQFTLDGTEFLALNGGPAFTFSARDVDGGLLRHAGRGWTG